MTRARPLIAAAALATILAGCAATGDSPEARGEDESPAVVVDSDSDTDAEAGQPTSDDPAEDDGDAPAASGGGGYLDELYADSLHDGVTPAAPGTAYIEIAGERFDFEEVTCTLSEEPGAEKLYVHARGESTGAGHHLYFERAIGEDIGWNWEDEYFQLALLTPDEDGTEQFSNSLIQHERAKGGDPEWAHGEGELPVLRIVGKEVTTVGALSAAPFAPDPVEGPYVAAVTCPEE